MNTYIYQAAISGDEGKGEVVDISGEGGGVSSHGHQAIVTGVLK